MVPVRREASPSSCGAVAYRETLGGWSCGAASRAPGRGGILTGKPGFSDPATDRGGGARSRTAAVLCEAGAGVDERRDGDNETVVCR